MISFIDSIIHSKNEQSNIHIQPGFHNRMLIRLLFFEKLHFFSSFFSKSRVRASSEFQTQTNCYMYVILFPVITATDLTSDDILYDLQYGFRHKHSTQHATLDIVNTILSNMDNRKYSCGIFIDLKKAFHTVNHEILLTKLEHYGIR